MIIGDDEFKNFIRNIKDKDIFIDYVLDHPTNHTVINSCIIIFVKVIISDDTYILNFKHQDVEILKMETLNVINIILQHSQKSFVSDKKKFINLFHNKNVYDVLIQEFQTGYDKREDVDFFTNYHTSAISSFGESDTSLNFIIPLAKHVQLFELKYNYYKEYIQSFVEDYSFTQLNGIITETLSEVECNGLFVDIDLYNLHFGNKGKPITTPIVYTEYNIFTSTGRPSNCFGKVNYSALNKDDGCRSSFVSRFGNSGMLLLLDYTAFHPHIIANLINFKLEDSVDIYDFLGKFYFNKETLTPEDIVQSKKITFKILYGGVTEEHKHIDFFNKVDKYIEHRWKFFVENGYVETPVFKRRITNEHISNPNPNKLFNYLLQASETEFSIQNIDNINKFLKNKKSRIILYTYDSILVDVSASDGRDTLKEIKSLMMNNQFPVKSYVGKNYHELVKIKL